MASQEISDYEIKRYFIKKLAENPIVILHDVKDDLGLTMYKIRKKISNPLFNTLFIIYQTNPPRGPYVLTKHPDAFFTSDLIGFFIKTFPRCKLNIKHTIGTHLTHIFDEVSLTRAEVICKDILEITGTIYEYHDTRMKLKFKIRIADDILEYIGNDCKELKQLIEERLSKYVGDRIDNILG